MKTFRLITILAVFTLLSIGCVDNTNTSTQNQNDQNDQNNQNDPNTNWVNNGEGTGNYVTEFVVSNADGTQRYSTKRTTTPFVGQTYQQQIDGTYKITITSHATLPQGTPQAKETNYYDHSYYENTTFFDAGDMDTSIYKFIMRPYDNAPYKTTWQDGTVTYSIIPYSYVNYTYDAAQDWLYGVSTTGFGQNDYTKTTRWVDQQDSTFTYFGLLVFSPITSAENLPQGTYTFVYLPPTANDHNDLIYETKTTPTPTELNTLYGVQPFSIIKSNNTGYYIVTPIIAGTPDNPAQPPPTEDEDDQNNLPDDIDGIPIE
jgi:hypothetical protein